MNPATPPWKRLLPGSRPSVGRRCPCHPAQAWSLRAARNSGWKGQTESLGRWDLTKRASRATIWFVETPAKAMRTRPDSPPSAERTGPHLPRDAGVQGLLWPALLGTTGFPTQYAAVVSPFYPALSPRRRDCSVFCDASQPRPDEFLFGPNTRVLDGHFPCCHLLIKGFMDKIPIEIEEAAVVDGCSLPRLLWQVVLPCRNQPWRPAHTAGVLRRSRL